MFLSETTIIKRFAGNLWEPSLAEWGYDYSFVDYSLFHFLQILWRHKINDCNIL